MEFFGDYVQPQYGGRGLPGWLESLQQQQTHQPGEFGGSTQLGPTASPTTSPVAPSAAAASD